jgi:hypothetical protein
MYTALSNLPDSWNEINELIGLLRAWGISYLVGLDHGDSSPKIERDQQSAVSLIQRLAQCDDYPRVRDASIALFLLHPELADAVLQAIQESEPEIAERLAVLTLATLYLQRLWSLRLTIALGHTPSFPEQRFSFLWESRNLPPPAYHDGKYGLIALQEAEQKRTGFPFTFVGDWQNQVDQLQLQEEAKHHQIQASLLLPLEGKHYEQELNMSMRPCVDKAAIEAFLQQLGSIPQASASLSCGWRCHCPSGRSPRIYTAYRYTSRWG